MNLVQISWIMCKLSLLFLVIQQACTDWDPGTFTSQHYYGALLELCNRVSLLTEQMVSICFLSETLQ